MRNPFDGSNPVTRTADAMLGDEGYRAVRSVAEISEEIKHLSQYMPQMYRLAELTKNLPDLTPIIENGIDFDKGADLRANLGMPNILTIGEEIKSRNVVPAARLGIKGDGSDETAAWKKAIRDDLPGLMRPVELNLGKVHRVASRLDFPSGSGIVNPGGASMIASFGDFNNSSGAVNQRYGTNAVVLSAVVGATGLIFDGIKLRFDASDFSVIKEKKVQGLVLRGVTDAFVRRPDFAGFNSGAMINFQSCKNFKLFEAYCHDSMIFATSNDKVGNQLTAILVDGDELLDSEGKRIGSFGYIDKPRVNNLRITTEANALVGDQTDGINVAGNFATVFINDPWIENVAEALDIFGRVIMRGGRFINCPNFAVKLVHGAEDCDIQGFYAKNVGIAGITLQSLANEESGRGIRNNIIRGTVSNVGEINEPKTTIHGIEIPAVTASAAQAQDIFEVLLNDVNPAYPVEGNLIEVEIQECRTSINPIRVTTKGTGNTVRFTNVDGSTNLKSPDLAAIDQVYRMDKGTFIKAFPNVAQAFEANTTTIMNFGSEVTKTDQFNEWNVNAFRPKLPGRYRITPKCRFPGNAGDILGMSIRLNGLQTTIEEFAFSAEQLQGKISDILVMKLGDVAEVAVKVSTAQSVTADSAYTSITITREPD